MFRASQKSRVPFLGGAHIKDYRFWLGRVKVWVLGGLSGTEKVHKHQQFGSGPIS